MTIVTLKIIGMIALALLAMCVAPLVLMLVWNAVVADMFDGPEITFWVAFGVVLVLNIIGGALRHVGG